MLAATVPAHPQSASTADDACYLALKARDARFDGHFFTGVTSTGIYCRPVCRVRTPQRANCRFFALAAQAEAAGFRPCLRCRPELAPHAVGPTAGADAKAWSTQDASQILAQQAAQLLDNPEPWSDGPPYDVDAMLAFFAARQIPGVESVDATQRSLARTLSLSVGSTPLSGWVQMQFVPERHQVVLHISESLAEALPLVLARVRALLDLDADPHAIQECLGADFPDSEGLRVPGCLDGFELAVRAVLGQQITVRAACTLATRLVQRYGAPFATPLPTLNRLFPTPQALSHATPDDLGALGIVRQRQGAIVALAQAVHSGALQLYPGAPLADTMTALQALPGIGPWTAHYIAMRALRWPDAFPSGDVALHKALGVQDCAHPQHAAEAASQRWRPWRSYAVLRAWARLADPAATPTPPRTATKPTAHRHQ